MKPEEILRPGPPHFLWTHGSAEAFTRGGMAPVLLRGGRMRNRAGLFLEFAEALSFPSYFGGNWDALDECLEDLEWLPEGASLLAILDAQDLLADEGDEDLRILAEILRNLGETRARQGRPFRVLMQTETPPEMLRFHQMLARMQQPMDALILPR